MQSSKSVTTEVDSRQPTTCVRYGQNRPQGALTHYFEFQKPYQTVKGRAPSISASSKAVACMFAGASTQIP